MTPDTSPFGARRKSIPVTIRSSTGGSVIMGGNAPVVVQSMTNTDTADVKATVEQVAALARAGSELVRITVDKPAAAKAVPHIRDQLDKQGVDVPLIGDFHYIGHKLLAAHPACAEALAKYRINPGNGRKDSSPGHCLGARCRATSDFAACLVAPISQNSHPLL